jgi:hypothetical protein
MFSPSSGSKQETGLKASGKQTNQLAEISDYVGISTPEAYGSVVVKTICYKPEGHGFETR